jgi:hypothetical protein
MEKKAMTQKTRTTLKKWMDFQLASVEATKLLETADHAVFVNAATYEDMKRSDPALEHLGNAR